MPPFEERVHVEIVIARPRFDTGSIVESAAYDTQNVVIDIAVDARRIESARGKHGDCSVVVVAANIEQMREKVGPFHRHWATRLATRVAEPFLDEANEAG